jgi:hypothetical protein
LVGALAAVVFTAAKGAAQVDASGVAGVRQEANVAVSAVNGAGAEAGRGMGMGMGMGMEDRVEGDLIVPDSRLSAIGVVPIGAKRETFLDGEDKKAKDSVIIESV